VTKVTLVPVASKVSKDHWVNRVPMVPLELEASRVFQANAVIQDGRDQSDNPERRDRKALQGSLVLLVPMEIKDFLDRRELLEILELLAAMDSQVQMSLLAVLRSVVVTGCGLW